MADDANLIDGVPYRPLGTPPTQKAPVQYYVAAKIPLVWIKAAYRARGGIVVWALWLHHGFAKKKPFRASLADLTLDCISMDTARRMLASLESAGLVRIERHSGCKSIITIIGPGITTLENSTS